MICRWHETGLPLFFFPMEVRLFKAGNHTRPLVKQTYTFFHTLSLTHTIFLSLSLSVSLSLSLSLSLSHTHTYTRTIFPSLSFSVSLCLSLSVSHTHTHLVINTLQEVENLSPKRHQIEHEWKHDNVDYDTEGQVSSYAGKLIVRENGKIGCQLRFLTVNQL